MNTYDVVIIGAGTAGLFLARELGKMKRKTLVLDRKANLLDFSFNTLSSFINLKDFDLTEDVVAQKLDRAILYSKNFKRTVKGKAYILDKGKIHKELLAAIDPDYVSIQLQVNIKELSKHQTGEFKTAIDKKGKQYSGKIFVDASGTNGIISKQVGLQNKKTKLATGVEYNVKYQGQPNEGHLFIGKQYQGGYAWIFPLQNQRAILGFGTFDNSIVKDLKARLHTILELPNIKKLVLKDNDIAKGGSIPLTPVLDKFVIENLVCVGDSVSQVNPIAGEGYKFIFEAAQMASKAIDTSLNKNDLTKLTSYESEWKYRFLLSYKRAKYSQLKLFRYSKNDILMDFLMLMAKLRSNSSIQKSLSGEFSKPKKSHTY